MAGVQACDKVKADMIARAAKVWQISPDMVEWRDGAAHPVDPAKPDLKPMTIAQLAATAGRTGGPITAQVSLNAQGAGPGFGVHLCDIEIDPETGHADVVR